MTEQLSTFVFSAEVMFSLFFSPLDFSMLLPVLIVAFLSLLRNIPLYSYNVSWILFCFFTHFDVHLSCLQLSFKIILLRILFYMSFGVHKYSSFLFDMYQEWNYWVLGNYIFGFRVIGRLKPCKSST